jgi:integrase/recombinase XerD
MPAGICDAYACDALRAVCGSCRALRAFFADGVRRGERSEDPGALLDPPKLPRLLPKALADYARDPADVAAAIERCLAAVGRGQSALLQAKVTRL